LFLSSCCSPRVKNRSIGAIAKGNIGFSLVEMLVVIAVAAVLAALLVPSAKTMLDSAQTSKAVSNLRQIGALMSSYVAENNNRLPAYQPPAWSTATNSLFWQNVLRMHAGLAVRGNPAADTWLPEIFYDPAVRKSRQHLWGCFGGNSAVMQVPNGMPLAKIATPGKKVLVASAVDTTGRGRFDSSWYFNGTNATTGPAMVDPRHKGKALCLFVDGHTEALDIATMSAAERRQFFLLDGN